MKKYIISLLAVLFCIGVTNVLNAQISGPASVPEYSQASYTSPIRVTWTCIGGNILSTFVETGKVGVIVAWTSAGQGSVMATSSRNGTQESFSVTIESNCNPFNHTYPAISQLSGANNSVLSYSGIAPVGLAYFWQTAPLGTNENHSGTSFTATAETAYYLRAKQTDGCWADNFVSINTVFDADAIAQPINPNAPNSESSTETTTGTLNRPNETSMTYMGNYIRSYTLLEEGTESVDFTALDAMPKEQVAVTTGYFDGLGRPSQTVQKSASPLGNDVVGFHRYDGFGRETKQYLPYASTEANGNFKNSAPLDQYNFYQNATNVAHTDWAFAETDFEASPLNRVLASASPGKSWVGSGNKVHSEQLINSEVDGIRIFSIDRNLTESELVANPLLALQSVGTYTDGQLLIQKLTDENGNETFGYTNKLGQTILKRSAVGDDGTFAQTYYVYDDFGNLRFILQPNAVELLAQNGFSLDFMDSEKQEAFEAQVFWYRYDHRNRPIAKKIPSQDGEVRMVYDQLDRLVLSQDAKQREESGEWNYTQYDALSRPVATGVCYFANKTHSQLLTLMKNQVQNVSSVLVGVGNTKDYNFILSFPHGRIFGASGIELLSVTYYDGYEAVNPTKYAFRAVTEFVNVPKTDFSNQTNRVRGMLTATRVKILNTNDWLWTVSHYDQKGRAIQIVADNHLGGVDATSTLYHDFNSRVLKSKMEISVNGIATKILTWKTYDHAGRVLSAHYKLNEQADELLATYRYNELGELISKTLGDNLQKVDFAYNIRGWLTKINDLDAEETEGAEDLWRAELSYDKGFGKVQLNGNIAGMKWSSKRSDDVHAYGYQYDKLNRLTQADYRYNNAELSDWTNAKQDFTVFGIDYDLNGNILKLNRQGAIGKNAEGDWLFGAMDRLNYSYSGNRLLAVDDKAGTDASAGDFMDIDQLYCSTRTDEYTYDANGSLTEDKNKGLSGMTYNRMNLPESVTTEEGEVHYGYDAAGIKLWKEVFENGTLKKRTDYLGGLIITDNQIEFIPHEEGRFLPKADGTYKTEFHYKDHLGNLRLAFREETAKYLVTMENANATEEDERFDNVGVENEYMKTRFIVDSDAHSGTAVSNLNGSQANRTIGPFTVLTAQKGDGFKLSAYAKDKKTGSNTTPSNFTLPFAGSSSSFGLEGASFLGNGIGIRFNPLNLLNPNGNSPNAYIVVHVMDGNENVLETYEQFMDGSNGWQFLEVDFEVTHKDAEYAVLFVANESPTDVYFDDLEIEHTRLIWQENAYYPFGMGIKPLDYEPEGSSGFLYNGKELDEETNLYDYESRSVDIQLGRFTGVDGHSENYYDTSPFTYVGNNPISRIDPDGKDWFYYKASGSDDAAWNYHEDLENLQLTVGDGEGGSQTVTLPGHAAVVVIEGNREETLGAGDNINGDGAITADVTVYAPDGTTNSYTGYTMTSDAPSKTPIDEGVYTGKRRAYAGSGQLDKHYRLLNQDGTDGIRTMDGVTNAYAPAQVNPETGEGYKNEIFFHRTNNSGWAGGNVSCGCLLLTPTDMASFNNNLSPLGNSSDTSVGTRTFTIVLRRAGATNNPTVGANQPVHEEQP
jgi:RHS repeat-associated protein